MAIDIAHQLYYVDVVDLALKNLDQLETLNDKVMDTIHKKHMTIFHKRLLICNLSLGLEVFVEGSNSL